MNSQHPLVFIAGPFNGSVMTLFYGLGYRGTNDLMIADLVVFTGGSDINPALYGHKKVKECGTIDDKRDAQEKAVFEAAKNFGIPMVGICRGAQLLNALNGGTLYQHTDGHIGNHWIADTRTGQRYFVTSTHHQMMIPGSKGDILAIASPQKDDLKEDVAGSLATIKIGDGVRIRPKKDDYDVEVVWYPETGSLCFQPHPEYNHAVETRGYFVELLDECVEGTAEPEASSEKETAA